MEDGDSFWESVERKFRESETDIETDRETEIINDKTYEELVEIALFTWLIKQNRPYWISKLYKDEGEARVELLERFCFVSDQDILRRAFESEDIESWGLSEKEKDAFEKERDRFSMESYLRSLKIDELKKLCNM